MIFVMLINLYTSRIVLNVLGVTDFGIYSVVGGIVVFFSFFSGPLTDATRRFLSYEIGKKDLKRTSMVFSTSLTIHAIMSFFLIVVAETVGLWFLYNKMQIPVERMNAAFFVFQCSIAVSIITLLCTPFNADMIANERMDAFAYISILEVCLKLAVVFLLLSITFDRLILYSFLLVLVQIFIGCSYSLYCRFHFKESKFHFSFDKKLFKDMLHFIGWTMTGGISSVCCNQGLNILLNMFFGPSVNAARAIVVQVQSGIFQFCNNFQTAISPQITKHYAQKDFSNMKTLIITGSKFSFFIVLLLSLPIMIKSQYILRLWLGIVPDYSSVFLRIILLTGLINALANPIIITNHATGDLKKFQIIVETIQISILPISYLVLKTGSLHPEMVFVIQLVISLIAQYARVKIVLPKIDMDLKTYFKEVIFPIIKVSFISIIFLYFISIIFDKDLLVDLIFASLSCMLLSLITIYVSGCTSYEKILINAQIRKRLFKLNNRM
jgi:O-antigen/teichoic acid export membrane protein